MFWTITAILLVLWTLGMTAGSTVGYWVHLLLLFAIASLIAAVLQRGRRVAT